MKKLSTIFLLPLITGLLFAQKKVNLPLTDAQKTDTLWKYTRGYNDPARYKVLSKTFTLTGTASIGRGVDNDDCDSTFNVICDEPTKQALAAIIAQSQGIKPGLNTDVVHIEITCTTNCDKSNCAGFAYPFAQPRVPAPGAKVAVTGRLVIEMHKKYILEIHPVSSIN